MDESLQKELRQLYRQRTTKLSEAIRIGARLRPQCRQVLFDGVGTCAMGAAAEARGWIPDQQSGNQSHSRFLPDLTSPDGWALNEMGRLIGKWNDDGMTREEIADRLEAMGY